ncbi:MAG: MMPL family transporter [Gammaproteobacteria bacterium]|nr:MMPL family transporter [Gammaproteobacteria bacterium]MDH3405853.1 MMPL family transporter [Gammaproteobacteria bacterium]
MKNPRTRETTLKIYHGIIPWRWWIIVASIASVLAAGSGMRFIEFSNNYRVFFSPENPQLQAFEKLQNVYTKSDNILIVVAPKDGRIFTRDTLATVKWITQEAWKLPYSSRVDSITNFQHTTAHGDDLVVRDLVENPAALSNAELARVREVALNEPLLRNRLIPPRAHVTGVNVTVVMPEKNLSEVPELTAQARALAATARARDPNIEVYLTGVVLMNNSFAEQSQKDMMTLVPIMFGVIVIIIFLTVRSLSGTIGALLVIVFSIVTTLGLVGWLDIKLTPPTASSPTVILTLAVADSIHILLTLFHLVRQGQDKDSAIIESMRINGPPVFLTSFTTVIGFLSMNFSEVPPFRDLGNIVAIGITAAWVYSVLFLPAFMAAVPVRLGPARERAWRAMEGFAGFVIRRRRPLLWGSLAVALGLLAFIPRNVFNDQFVKYFDESVEFRRATDFVQDNLSGMYQVHYSLGAGESGGISDPAYLRKVEEFAVWFRSQQEVTHVHALTDTMKRLNKNLHDDKPEWYRLPASRELSAQYLLLYELSLPFGLDLNDQINVDKSATRVVVTMNNITTKRLLALEDSAQQWLRDNAPPAMFTTGTGPAVMFSNISARNIRSMLGGNIMALVLVSGLIMLAVRSLRFGFISLIPNMIPAGLAFGIWGLLVGEVGMSLSVVTALTFGIVVDDTIHFMTKYLHARRDKGLDPHAAVRYAFSTVGMALFVTSLVLVAGFYTLTFSAFWLNASMGMMCALTIALALIADYLLLPPLLMKLEETAK